MRSSLIAAIVAVASPAVAQPVTSPSACSVDLVRAPEDVRTLVEKSLADARHCSVALEVRIVPTKDGLYIMARDDRGTVRDRVVPDAQTAAALIASWADDGQPAPIATIDFHADVRLAPMQDIRALPPSAPGLVPAAGVVDDGGPRERARPHHWISEFLLFGGGVSAFHGLRAEADIIYRPSWTAGVSATLAETRNTGAMSEELTVNDLGMTVYVTHPFRLGGWDMQPAAALGFVWTKADDFGPPTGYDPLLPGIYYYEKVSPIAEVSFLASHALVGNLAAAAGVVVTAYGQHFNAMDPQLQNRSIDAVAITGFRFGFL